jgi:hypothetical protein
MRWLFCNENDADESAQRQAILDRVDRWWREFQAKTGELDALFSRRSQWDLPGWMDRTLQAIDAALMWEYGAAVQGPGHRLVITPESERRLRPLTATIIERAPQLTGWEFYAYRLPEGAEMARQTVEVRTGGSIDDVLAEARLGSHHLVDLVFHSPRTDGAEDQQALNDAFVATETLLGEEILDTWIGAIEVGAFRPRGGLARMFGRGKDRPTGLIPLERLKETVDALIGGIQDQLPAEPHFRWAADSGWSAIELKPSQADDYPERTDLYVAITATQELWMAAHSGRPFCSQRFSRCGEVFAYVKLDGSEGLEGSRFADRTEIEDALNAALGKEALGGTIGGGTGVRYSYIDLALTDLRRGVEAVRSVLRDGRVPRRSWILFFDADLCGEWVGIYDATPPPPSDSDGSDEDAPPA